MSKNLSSKYYQENKDYKKSNNMIVNITKISQKMQNKSLLSIEKGYRMKKNAYNYKKHLFYKINVESINLNF